MVKAASREEVGSLEMWCWLGAVWRPCTAGKMGKWSQNEVSLRLHWRRKDDAEARSCREQTECFGKDESSGKTEGNRERGRPPLIWADCVRGAAGRVCGRRAGLGTGRWISLSFSHTHTAINTCVAWGLEESERSLVLLSSSLPVGHVPANLVYR